MFEVGYFIANDGGERQWKNRRIADLSAPTILSAE
jgi:hypothetical protein